MDLTPADRIELSDLCMRYARHADDRQFPEMAACFAENAELDTSRSVRNGRAEIEATMHNLTRYDRTFHAVGQSHHWVEGGEVRGLTYCIAHHFTDRPADEGGGTADQVMYIRYHDACERDADGRWVFAKRRLEVTWAGAEDKAT